MSEKQLAIVYGVCVWWVCVCVCVWLVCWLVVWCVNGGRLIIEIMKVMSERVLCT